MKSFLINFVSLVLLVSCNKIETNDTLNKSNISLIQDLNLIDENEKIIKFYSEYRKENSGNFFTNKRVAKYWIDKEDESKNVIYSAFYKDIKSIDTIYNAGLTYCPYLMINKIDGTSFKVSVEGSKAEVKSFFEDLLKEWDNNKK
ncbi:hypothetical protein GCM10010992_06500 [Cloacibacterium rupense]|uniref:Lipoprotein n=1 Tax=Cloacibacterium rupense TaxID=517423 RepID=A0ABQ2NH78_9FLAO|nr:hypothetical protein [Cloacibacterium rupense]GGP02374.1 hypothetical protein GCM10010992_06500 [Cloacibacterium rupense]